MPAVVCLVIPLNALPASGRVCFDGGNRKLQIGRHVNDGHPDIKYIHGLLGGSTSKPI